MEPPNSGSWLFDFYDRLGLGWIIDTVSGKRDPQQPRKLKERKDAQRHREVGSGCLSCSAQVDRSDVGKAGV